MTARDPAASWPLPPGPFGALVTEWLTIAQDDAVSAVRDFDAPVRPSYQGACYRAQQAIEKLMKAVLTHRGVMPPKTHDLVELSELLETCCPGWRWSEAELRTLTLGAVQYRYPGQRPNRNEAEQAIASCAALWQGLTAIL